MVVDTKAFVKGIISGEIKPSSVRTELDKQGNRFTIFDFPEFKCQIHSHFADVEREKITSAHIIPYSRDEKSEDFLDNFALAVLRHHAEESTPRHQKTRKRTFLLWIVVALVIVVVVLVLLMLLSSPTMLPFIYTLF